jgi:hypothetical protein
VAVDLLRETDELQRCLAALDERLADGADGGQPDEQAIGAEAIAQALARGHRIVAELTALLGRLQGVRASKERLDRALAPRTL